MLAYAWCRCGSEVSGNLLKFFTWFSFAIGTLVLVTITEKTRESILKTYREDKHAPVWLDGACYAAIVVVLAGFGHWVLAIVWIYHAMRDFYWRAEAGKVVTQ